jgi:hypothetical protein
MRREARAIVRIRRRTMPCIEGSASPCIFVSFVTLDRKIIGKNPKHKKTRRRIMRPRHLVYRYRHATEEQLMAAHANDPSLPAGLELSANLGQLAAEKHRLRGVIFGNHR